MALFGKKKKDSEEVAANVEEVKSEETTLDLIKEAMEEAKEEKHSQLQQQTAEVAAETAQPQEGGEMPTEEEIRKAQEILARAQAQSAAKVGINSPINGTSLKAVVSQFVQSKTQDNLKLVMNCIQNPATMVCVPAQIVTSKENEEKMKQGGEVKLEGPVHINPVILTDNTGKKVLPVFSSEDAIPDDLKQKSPKVNMPIAHCVNILKGIKDVDTFVLDPYTANIRVAVNAQENNK